jgi:predicted nucleotidyltransferase
MDPIPIARAELAAWADAQAPSALFWSISGSHLYGFSSADSDIDLRECFQAPLPQLVGLKPPPETIEPKTRLHGVEVEAVTHEIGKYLRLLCRHNGYVLEQIFSPLVVAGEEFLERLRPLASQCVTRNCYHHYRGFFQTQRKLLEREDEPRVKTLLYAYRVALTGEHLLATGEVEANLSALNERFQLPFIAELIERKRNAEGGSLPEFDAAFHRSELDRWQQRLDEAYVASRLPEAAPMEELHQFLVELRLGR